MSLSIMSILVSVALPVWQTVIRHEREEELIFRGRQYARAIALFQRKYAGTFPPSIDALVQGHFLRRRYLDPMTGGDFQLLFAGLPSAVNRPGTPTVPVATNGRRGILGVVSRSHDTSLRVYKGRNRYSEWLFIAGTEEAEVTQLNSRARAPGN